MTEISEPALERRPERVVAIDYIKALAIVAVAFTHAGLPYWDASITSYDRILCGFWVQFHVPSFLLLSGLLYYSPRRIGLRPIGARLSRVIVPYLIASALVQIAGFSNAKDFGDVVFQFATASSLGIYYYIFLLVIFIPSLWILSRMSPRMNSAALACVFGGTFGLEMYFQMVARGAEPAGVADLFWLMRSPFNYSYTMFLGGWIAAAYLPQLRRLLDTRRLLIGVLCVLGIVVWTAAHVWRELFVSGGVLRYIYTLSVVVGLVLLLRNGRQVGIIRFLSDTTLGLYLYHHIFQTMAAPHVADWHPLLRIFTLAFGGLIGASAVCWISRRLLGPKAKLLFGA